MDGTKIFLEVVILGLDIWYIVWLITSIKKIKNEFLPDIKMYLTRINQKMEQREIRIEEISKLNEKIYELEKKIENINKTTPE